MSYVGRQLLRMRLYRQRYFKFFVVTAVLFLVFIVSRWSSPPPPAPGLVTSSTVALPGDPDPATVYRYPTRGNYEPVEQEKPSSNPGENGRPVHITDEEGKKASQASIAEYGFNEYVSSQISLTRTIPDVRPIECKYWHYPKSLPTVSVVIVFHNEGWSALLRTVHSVLLRSPPQLLKEIIMVDDVSTKKHLKARLEEYIHQFDGTVRLLRATERLGLIGARNLGAKAAVADVVVFLDAHCEVNVNWLPPLLAPIKHNRKVMTVPIIGGIEAETWEYRSNLWNRLHSGIFEWGLLYKETQITEKEQKNRHRDSMPFRSSTHAGGLFAIDRKWFAELGYYDDGLKIWGGEQYELSFKSWMCGGGILFVPCSHVGHVYRSRVPYTYGKYSGKPITSKNMKRVVKTWMGDYEQYYLTREPQAAKIDPGDLTEQIAIKERLQCKDFHWYMENVAYDVLPSYPLLPPNKVWGQAKNTFSQQCLERLGSIPGRLGVGNCRHGGTRILRLNTEGQLAQGEWCLRPNGNAVQSEACVKGTVDGPWRYDEETKQIMTIASHCITMPSGNEENSSQIRLMECDATNELQKFEWKEFYESL